MLCDLMTAVMSPSEQPGGGAYDEGAMDGDDPAGLSRIGACPWACAQAASALAQSKVGVRRPAVCCLNP